MSLEAEKAVLGSALISADATRFVVANLAEKHFTKDTHRIAFKAVVQMLNSRTSVDPVTLFHSLSESEKLKVDWDEINTYIDAVSSSDHVKHYVKIVQGAYYDEQIKELLIRSYDSQNKTEHIDRLRELCRRRDSVDSVQVPAFKDGLITTLDDLDKGKGRGFELGIPVVDSYIAPIEPQDLLVMAARTAHGKTLAAVNIALSLGQRGIKTSYFSGEMSADQIRKRMLSIQSGVPALRLRHRTLDATDLQNLNEAATKMSDYPISISDLSSPSLSDITSHIDATNSQVGIVDYLTRCRLPQSDSYRLRVQHFMVGLKSYCKDSGKNIILLAQIRRPNDEHKEVLPTLADIKESSSIEEEADGVILLFMDEAARLSSDSATQKWLISKNRHGTMGTVDVNLDKSRLKIMDIGGTTARIAEFSTLSLDKLKEKTTHGN